jgi:hypothetical protein
LSDRRDLVLAEYPLDVIGLAGRRDVFGDLAVLVADLDDVLDDARRHGDEDFDQLEALPRTESEVKSFPSNAIAKIGQIRSEDDRPWPGHSPLGSGPTNGYQSGTIA